MKCVEAPSAKGAALGVVPDPPVGHLPTVCTFVCILHTPVLRPTWEFWLMFQKGRAFGICPWHFKFFWTSCFYNLVCFRPDAIIRLLSWFAVSVLINTEQKGRFYQCGAIKPPWPCSSETFTVVYPSEWGWRRENNKLKPPPCIDSEKDSFSTCVSGSHWWSTLYGKCAFILEADISISWGVYITGIATIMGLGFGFYSMSLCVSLNSLSDSPFSTAGNCDALSRFSFSISVPHF